MQLEGSQQNTDRFEALRHILEARQNRDVSYDEALEIGESLVSYFKLLAEDSSDAEAEHGAA